MRETAFPDKRQNYWKNPASALSLWGFVWPEDGRVRGERLRDPVVATAVADREAETRAWTTNPTVAEGTVGNASRSTKRASQERKGNPGRLVCDCSSRLLLSAGTGRLCDGNGPTSNEGRRFPTGMRSLKKNQI